MKIETCNFFYVTLRFSIFCFYVIQLKIFDYSTVFFFLLNHTRLFDTVAFVTLITFKRVPTRAKYFRNGRHRGTERYFDVLRERFRVKYVPGARAPLLK